MHAAEGGVKMKRCAVALQTVYTGNMGLMDSNGSSQYNDPTSSKGQL